MKDPRYLVKVGKVWLEYDPGIVEYVVVSDIPFSTQKRNAESFYDKKYAKKLAAKLGGEVVEV